MKRDPNHRLVRCTQVLQSVCHISASDFLGFPFIPEVFYLGKKVQIIGIIKEYKGLPEIIVKIPDQDTLYRFQPLKEVITTPFGLLHESVQD